MAVLGGQDVGLFVAVAGFTADAYAEARVQEPLTEEDKQRLPLRPVYFLALSE